MDIRDIQAASMVVSNLFRGMWHNQDKFNQEQLNHVKDAMISLRRAMPLIRNEDKHMGYENHVDMVRK